MKMVSLTITFVVLILLSFCCDKSSGQATLSIAGSTFAESLWVDWSLTYSALRGQKLSRIEYSAVGNDPGIDGLLQGKYELATSEIELSEEDLQICPELVSIPVIATSLAVVFNVGDIRSLNLTRETMVQIFTSKITKWDHPMIAASNPGVTLPSENITMVVRADRSASNFVMTSYLHYSDPSFPAFTLDKWPNSPNYVRATGTPRSALTVLKIPYSIGFLRTDFANTLFLNKVALENREGNFVLPSEYTIQSSMNASVGSNIVDVDGEHSYPLSFYSFVIYRSLSTNLTLEKSTEIFQFLYWVTSSEGSAKTAKLNGYQSIFESRKELNFETLKQFTFHGKKVFEIVYNPYSQYTAVGGVVISLACIMILLGIGLCCFIVVTHDFPVIKAFSPQFAFLILMGCICGFISLILWSIEISPLVCQLRLWFTSIGYPLIMSNLLAKNYRLYRIFTAGLKELLQEKISNNRIYAFSAAGVSIHVIILICWTAIDPPTVSTEFLQNGNYNFCHCQSKEIESIFTITLLVYNATLLFMACILAFLVRKLPLSYNESRHISYVCYNFAFGAVLVPIFLSEKNNERPEQSTAILYCILFFSFVFPMVALFTPKVYHVYRFGNAPESFSWRKSDNHDSKPKNHQGSFARTHDKSNGEPKPHSGNGQAYEMRVSTQD